MKTTSATSAQLAQLAEVHAVTVRNWKRFGHIPIETLEYLEYALKAK